MFASYRDLFNPDDYLRARTSLSNTFDPTSDAAADKPQRRNRESLADTNIHGKTIEVFYALVDYVTANVARFALRGIPSKFWHVRLLSGLAKTSAKIKFLFTDVERHALQSLEDGQDTLAQDEIFNALGVGGGPLLDIIGPDGQPFQVRASKDPRKSAADSADIHRLLTQEARGVGMYYSEMAMVSSWTIDSLRVLFFSFQRSDRSGYTSDAFDICGLVYKAGLDGLPTLVYQDRDGELMGTSTREFIKLSYSGFKMLSQVARVLQDERNARPKRQDETMPVAKRGLRDHTGAILVLDFEEEAAEGPRPSGRDAATGVISCRLALDNMGDLITVFVPLIVAQPVQLAHLIWAADIITPVSSMTHTLDYDSPRGPRFTVFASLRTNAYEATVRPTFDASDARSLSQSLIAQNRLYTHDLRDAPSTNAWEVLPITERRSLTSGSERKLHDLDDRFRDWHIEENAIVVKKPWYVIWVMLGCAVLTIGGLMVGCFLGERLTGVDPFNITVFAWVLAGFIIVVAKSLLVSEWPWRDFLKGVVPCRSVSELQAVTKVDSQEILQYLLSRELHTILIVKGPYHRPFLRKSDGDGFSIDVKMELRTLLASGIIVVKVTGRQGPGLVCLDLRRGAPGRRRVSHSDKIEEDEHTLGCFELDEAFDEGQDVPLLKLSGDWTRILGIYNKPKKRFR